MSESYEIVHMESRAELSAWLAANHRSSPGIWLSMWRTAAQGPRIDYESIVEECLRYGWIDSTARTFDDHRGGLRLTPRKPGSVWSRTNKVRIERLMAADLMEPAGLAALERAKADGSWEFLDDIEELVVPDDLASALAAAGARDGYDSLTPGRRKQLLAWIKMAKRDVTRQARIAKVVAAAAEGRSALE